MNADAALNAPRVPMPEYERLREELAEERSINADLVARLEDLARDATDEEHRKDALFTSLRRAHRSVAGESTYEHILLASMPVTDAERGYDERHTDDTRLRDELEDAQTTTISLLAEAVHAKDAYTHGHCEQVSRYAHAAAGLLGLSEEQERITCFTALLHDVGKIGVSDDVLNKPGPLIEEERTLVQAHSRIGHDLLAGVPALRDVAHAVLHHHERYDGNGYPNGLAGDDIPVASRIVAAIDAYCAMIDERSYKRAFTAEYARDELRRCAGTQFHPDVVDAVLRAIEIVDGAAESHATG